MLTTVQDYPTTLPAPPAEKVAIVTAVYDVRKVRISDGEQVARGYFTERILGKLFQRFGGAYDVELPKYYVLVRASPELIEVNGKEYYVIKIDRLVLLEEMPKKEDMPEALSCYLRRNGKQNTVEKDTTAGGKDQVTTPPPENITFKSDAMNLIKRAVSNLTSPQKPALQLELIDRMKSRIGAALTCPLKQDTVKEETGPDPKNATALKQESSSKVNSTVDSLSSGKQATDAEVKSEPSANDSCTKQLRSFAGSRNVSLRSGKSYGKWKKEDGEASSSETTTNSWKRKRDASSEEFKTTKKCKAEKSEVKRTGTRAGRGSRISVGTAPGTSGTVFKKEEVARYKVDDKAAAGLTRADDDTTKSSKAEPPAAKAMFFPTKQRRSSPINTKEKLVATDQKTSRDVKPSTTDSTTDPTSSSSAPADEGAPLTFIKSEPKEDKSVKSPNPRSESPARSTKSTASTSGQEHSSPVRQPSRGARRGASTNVCQPSSAWDISPPLLEIMKNFVHKHFAMWN